MTLWISSVTLWISSVEHTMNGSLKRIAAVASALIETGFISLLNYTLFIKNEQDKKPKKV